MKRTITALAALAMLATAGSVRAGQYANYNLYGTYVETFQGATAAGAPVSGVCQLTFDGAGNIVLGTATMPASYCFTDNGISNGDGCFQAFASTSDPVYSVMPDGTGSITGTLSPELGCGTTFSENLLIQQVSGGLMAENVLVERMDAGAVVSGHLVPQSYGSFSNATLYGDYTESLAGTMGGNAFTGYCNDVFNGQADPKTGMGGVSGKCMLNMATIGMCEYELSGSYMVWSQGHYGLGAGMIYPTNLVSISGPFCETAVGMVPFSEFFKIVNGTGTCGSFMPGMPGQLAAFSMEPATIYMGTYMPRD